MKQLFSALLLGAALAARRLLRPATTRSRPANFPDGTQATKEEMLDAKKSVVKYNADMEAYLGCIKSEYDAKSPRRPM